MHDRSDHGEVTPSSTLCPASAKCVPSGLIRGKVRYCGPAMAYTKASSSGQSAPLRPVRRLLFDRYGRGIDVCPCLPQLLGSRFTFFGLPQFISRLPSFAPVRILLHTHLSFAA